MKNTVVIWVDQKQELLRLSNEDMAERIGISAGALFNLRAGREPSTLVLKRLYQSFPDSLKAITDFITTPDLKGLDSSSSPSYTESKASGTAKK